MNEDQFFQNLSHFNLKLSEACEMIFTRTGIYISPAHVRTKLSRTKNLSRPMAAAFKMLFRELENGKI